MSGSSVTHGFSGLNLDSVAGRLTRNGQFVIQIGGTIPVQCDELEADNDLYRTYSRCIDRLGVATQVWVDGGIVRRSCCAIGRSAAELREGATVEVELQRHAAWKDLLEAAGSTGIVRATRANQIVDAAFYAWGSAVALCGSGSSGDSACLVLSDASVAPWHESDRASPQAMLRWFDAQGIASYRWYHDPAFWRPLPHREIETALHAAIRSAARIRWDRQQAGLAFGDRICFSRSLSRDDALRTLPGLVSGYQTALLGSLDGWELELAFFPDERIRSVGLTLTLPGLPRHPFEERREQIIKATLENLLLDGGVAAAEDGEKLGVGLDRDGWGAEIYLNFFYPATKPAAG